MSLHLDWASYRAAKYAVEHWHYSGCMPAGKTVKVGVWEDKQYKGVVVFSRGASPFLRDRYELQQTECVELTRVALKDHRYAVTKILSIAIKILKKFSPNLRLVVSFADPEQSHLGVIYQAANWIYTGQSGETRMWNIQGKRMHERSVGAIYGTTRQGEIKKLFPNMTIDIAPGKYRYLYPLDKDMRQQIEPLAKSYPKRPASIESDAESDQDSQGGASPTAGLKDSQES